MRQNIVIVVIFCVFMGLVGLGAQQFVLKNYHSIEALQYTKSIQGLIHTVQNQIGFLENAAGDYAEWDDTYEFMKGTAPEYIDNNFRDENKALATLGVDFIVYTHLDKSPVYSAYREKSKMNEIFEKLLLSMELSEKEESSFLFFKDQAFIFHRHLISNSDLTAEPNGYLYVGKRLDEEVLMKSHLELKNLRFTLHKEMLKNEQKQVLESIHYNVQEHYLNEVIETYIHIFDAKDEYVFCIETTYPRDIVMQGQNTMHIFLGIVGAMFALILFLFWQRQKTLLGEKERFEILVTERTGQLQSTMHELHVAISQLKTIAYVDGLTDVHSRRSFFEKFTLILEEATQSNREITFAMIDLDDFKKINDTYGHDTGDKVLIHFCRSCEKFLDDSMLLARLGGEEFVIGFKQASVKESMAVCQKIQNYIEQNPVKINKALMISYTVSIGIADNFHSSDIDTILKEADEKLYGAKAHGKNIIRTRYCEKS